LLGFPEVELETAAIALCAVFGIDEASARPFVENMPSRVRSGLVPDHAQEYIQALNAIGADVAVICENSGEARLFKAGALLPAASAQGGAGGEGAGAPRPAPRSQALSVTATHPREPAPDDARLSSSEYRALTEEHREYTLTDHAWLTGQRKAEEAADALDRLEAKRKRKTGPKRPKKKQKRKAKPAGSAASTPSVEPPPKAVPAELRKLAEEARGTADPKRREAAPKPARTSGPRPAPAADEAPASTPAFRSRAKQREEAKQEEKAQRVSLAVLIFAAIGMIGIMASLVMDGGASQDQWPPAGFGPQSVEDLNLHEVSDAIPRSPAGEGLTWMLSALNGEVELSPAVVLERFAPATFAETSGADLVASIVEDTGSGPYELLGYVEAPEEFDILVAVRSGNGGYFELRVRVEDEEPHQLKTFWLRRW